MAGEELIDMNSVSPPVLTAFIGIYNGANFLNSLQNQLLGQELSDFPIVVVDNCSTDDSWNLLQEWKSLFGTRLRLYRNELNLGGGGSLQAALRSGKIETKWFTALHQDDIYNSNHLATLNAAILASDENVVAICTSMGSVDFEGNRKPTPPRASWLVSEENQQNSFLLNLRTQTLSWPSTAFSTEHFIASFVHVHSPSFSDTEATLRLCALGEFRYLLKETMQYRENPQSESHVINPFEARVGAALGLSRIFTSKEFESVLKLVIADRSKFFLELMASIEVRLGDSPLCEFVKILASEECVRVWDYQNVEASTHLASVFTALDSEFTSSLISKKSRTQPTYPNNQLALELKAFSNLISHEVFSMSTMPNKRRVSSKALSILPLRFRRTIFKIYVKARAIKQPNYYWNVFWK